MSALVMTAWLLGAVGAAYAWLHVPWLQPFALQAFAASLIFYLLLKRMAKTKVWHLAPRVISWEMPIVTFAVLLIIGATGNLNSWLYPLTFVHLFFLVMVAPRASAIVTTLAVVWFHYTMTTDPTWSTLIHLSTLPLVLIFFIFAQAQYAETIQDELIIKNQQTQLKALKTNESHLQQLVVEFALPKLEFLLELSQNPSANQAALQGQLWLLHQELTQATTPETTPEASINTQVELSQTWTELQSTTANSTQTEAVYEESISVT